MSTILVTGGCGMIGSRVVERLSGSVAHDISIDSQHNVERRFYKHPNEFEGIIHLASVSRLGDGHTDPERCFYTNVAGTINTLEIARQCGAWVILGSTREVMAGRRPQSMYELSKLTAEYLGERYAFDYGERVLALRFSDVYGADPADSDRMLPKMLACAKAGRVVVSMSPHVYCPTHIDDTVDAILAGVEWITDMPRGAFGTATICGPDVLTPRRLASWMKEILGPNLEIIETEPTVLDRCRSMEVPRGWLAKQLLGWTPERSFRAWLERELRA